MPIPVTTYEEMVASRKSYNEAFDSFGKSYFSFLHTILEEVGFTDKLVKLKSSNVKGQFKIDSTPYSRQPWEIKFHPVRHSDGSISIKSKYLNEFRSWDEKTLSEQLKDIAEVVGDLP